MTGEGRVPSEWHGPLEADQEAFLAEVQAFQSGRSASPWEDRPLFALDADVTVYWPDVRPCYEGDDVTAPASTPSSSSDLKTGGA